MPGITKMAHLSLFPGFPGKRNEAKQTDLNLNDNALKKHGFSQFFSQPSRSEQDSRTLPAES